MTLLIVLGSIAAYVAMWFVSARISYIVCNQWAKKSINTLPQTGCFWVSLFWPLFLPFVVFPAFLYHKVFSTSKFNIIDFVTEGPKNHFRSKAGIDTPKPKNCTCNVYSRDWHDRYISCI